MPATIEKNVDHEEQIKKINDLIKGIRIAMLTTEEEDGSLRSRPMATQEEEFDGTLWFFTYADSGKVFEVQHDKHVNLSYADPGANTYVSVSGTARLIRDQQKARELWKPALKAWFPGGSDDPNLALLKVDVDKSEYWDSPSNKIVIALGLVKALATGKPANNIGENKEVVLK